MVYSGTATFMIVVVLLVWEDDTMNKLIYCIIVSLLFLCGFFMNLFLLPFKADARTLDSMETTQKVEVVQFAPVIREKLPVFAVTSEEYKAMTPEQSVAKTEDRANALCVIFGFNGASAWTVMESESEHKQGWVVGKHGIAKQTHDLAWSSWSAITLFAGAPVWYNHRLFKTLTCYKYKENSDE